MKIVILDGIWGNHTRWEPFRKKLADSISETVIYTYDNSGRVTITELAKAFAKWMTEQKDELAIIGYSMGGIVAREAAKLNEDRHIVAAAFLHCPHQGSLCGRVFDSPATRELAPGSNLLAKLPAHKFPIMTTWTPFDLVVVPGNSASLQCERNIRIDIPAHNAPVWSGHIHKAVIKFLSEKCGNISK